MTIRYGEIRVKESFAVRFFRFSSSRGRRKKIDSLRSRLEREKARKQERDLRIEKLKATVSALKIRLRSECPVLASDDFLGKRRLLANTWLRGEGIEIGALHNPTQLSSGLKVKYVDRLSREEARDTFPELAALPLVEVDFVTNAETLDTVPDGSQDFLIANHVLEHCEDAIGTLKNWFRVLRNGGILFATVPDARYTFDYRRGITPLSHLIADHEEGPEKGNRETYWEWHQLVSGAEDPKAATARSLAKKENIHFHAWTQAEFFELFGYLRKELAIPVEIECGVRSLAEITVVARKEEIEPEDLATKNPSS